MTSLLVAQSMYDASIALSGAKQAKSATVSPTAAAYRKHAWKHETVVRPATVHDHGDHAIPTAEERCAWHQSLCACECGGGGGWRWGWGGRGKLGMLRIMIPRVSSTSVIII